MQRWTAYGKLVNGISRSFNLSGVPISALLILNKSNVRLIEPHFRMEQELVEFLLDGLLLLNNTLNTLFEGSKSGSLNCFLSKSSIFAGEETEKVYDTDCTYSSQWRGLLPFYSCREDGVELPNQWESCREVHRLLSDRCQYFRWRDSGRSECCQIRPRLREREWKLNFSDLRAYPLIILANVFY